MIEITYNHASDIGKGWVSGSQRFKDGEEFFYWLIEMLNKGKEILVTSYQNV